MGKRMFLFLVFVGMAVSMQAQVKPGKQLVKEFASQVNRITAVELKEKMTSGKPFFLIDIRTEKEFEAGHLDGAKWIPRGKLEFSLPELTDDSESVIILYCRSGARSTLANWTLIQMGYRNVFDLEGGFQAWTGAGFSAFTMHGEFSLLNAAKKENSWH